MTDDFSLRMSASRMRKRFLIVAGCVMKPHHDVGMLVQAGSSNVSFNKIAVKSKAKHFSNIDRVCSKLSHRMWLVASPDDMPNIGRCCNETCWKASVVVI